MPSHAKATLPKGVFIHDVPDIAEQIASGTLPGPLGVTALTFSDVAPYRMMIVFCGEPLAINVD